MPRLNLYKAAKTKKPNVVQSYYVGGLTITQYKNGGILVSYSTPTNKPYRLHVKPNTKEAKFYMKMIRAK